jgi:pyruvate/2-oxoglutarate dehydrogenase complex dihydrolipoamide acyltransferase (E2) component
MDEVVPLTKNRHFVIDLLTRATKFHCPVTTAWQFDVEDLNHARLAHRVNERPLSMTACLIKATGMTLKAHPRLNHHLFTGLFRRYEVSFETVCCTLIVMRRGPNGERILLPLLIDRVDEMSVIDIQKAIDKHRYGKLEHLPQFAAAERIKSLPRLALSWFSFKARSDHRFYRRYFGTYGISEMATGAFGPRGGHVVANTASAFVIGPRFQHAEMRNGALTSRLMQGITLVSDHYIIDGIDIMLGMKTFEKLLSDPRRLGLEPAGGA